MNSPTTQKLYEILNTHFGFQSFRPYQEAVCKEATEGTDLLLVMPTGAGKSLCYQVPGLARGGTTLVISPLLALIEDQVAKLQSQGLRAERIHSGRNREDSRKVCVDYLNGGLDFLFIAPERLAVPGFLELLARRKPSLIAIDEAHCISQWGHDFRPEYRMLGQRLPMLRPSPIIALTATATPAVQKDICEQLGIPKAKKFIHGFRRTNIAIEIAELNPGERGDAVIKLLTPPENRPAIVYAPTRKKADEMGDELSRHFSVATYHAGLNSEKRDSVQTKFLTGKIDVIVATIAFGMGIDKNNVRTVCHIALPASIEGYYQEIGRAGRDGLPSRAVLMQSYIDRKTHEFFFERDYPEPEVLEKIYKKLSSDAETSEDLAYVTRIKSDTFEKALEKLWIHGGAVINSDQQVFKGTDKWRGTYVSHCNHRKAQLDLITNYANSNSCHMQDLVEYFGDTSDHGKSCGLCDFCSPETAIIKRFRELNDSELDVAEKIILGLAPVENEATGKLYRDTFNEKVVDRRLFERVLTALVNAAIVSTFEDSFEKDGRTISFKRASLTRDGEMLMKNKFHGLKESVTINEEPSLKKSKSKKKSKNTDKKEISPASEETIQALKAWRLGLAKTKKVPAFKILSDRVLTAIAEARPTSEADLLEIHGMGPKLSEKYGTDILTILSKQ